MFSYDVKVFPFKSQSKARAFASIVIEGVMEVKGFKVFEGANGLFVSAPSREGKPDADGKKQYYPDVVFLDTPEEGKRKTPFEQELEQAIIAKYKEVTAGGGRQNAASAQREEKPSRANSRPKVPDISDEIW
jgi:DNA-binding cell septation regulator SpoVG